MDLLGCMSLRLALNLVLVRCIVGLMFFCYMKRIHFCPFNARSNDVLMWDVVTVVVVYR